ETWSSATPADSGSKASCRSARRRCTAPAARPTGSRARTRHARRCGVRPRRTGGDNMDRWVPELFLISLLAAICGGLACIHDHELFAAAFAAAAVVAASHARI